MGWVGASEGAGPVGERLDVPVAMGVQTAAPQPAAAS